MGEKYCSKLLSSLQSNQIHETVSVEDERKKHNKHEREDTVIHPFSVIARNKKSWVGNLGMRLIGKLGWERRNEATR